MKKALITAIAVLVGTFLYAQNRPEEDKKMLRVCEKAMKDYAFDIALEVVNAVL